MALLSDNEVRLRIAAKTEGDKEVQRLEATVESLEKELESLGKTTKAANAEQLKASKQLADARAEQAKIRQTLNETNEEYKRQMALVRQGGNDQQKYADEAAATRRRMDQLRASFNAAGKEVFRLNDEYKRAAAQSRFLSSEQRRVSQELKDAGAAAQRAREKFAAMAKGAKETAGMFDGLRARIAAAVAALGGFIAARRAFTDVTDAAETLDVQMRKIEATIQATGGAAGLSAQEIGDMAKRLDEATLGSAEGFRNAAAKLLTFKSIGKDTFETTLKLAQDLAANGFGTLESNVVQLGKALENPKQGISALAEAGVTFSEQQKTLIAYLVETGKQAQAHGVVLQAVAGQVEGVASAVGQGMSGAADLAGKRFTDLKEILGKGLLPVLADFYNGLADLFKRLTDSGAVERFGKVLGDVFRGAGEAFLRFLGQVDLDALGARMSTWADQSGEAVTRWIGYIESAGNSAKLVFSAISTGANIVLSAILKIAQGAAWVHSKVAEYYASMAEIISKITFGSVSDRFKELADDIRTHAGAMGEVADAFGESASAAFDRAISGAESFQEAWSGLTDTASDTADAIESVGKSATLTADQVAAMGNDTEFVNGELRKVETASGSAANGLGVLTDATKKAADEQMRLTEKTLAVESAFEKLGITSSATLQKQADEAKAAYALIKSSGMATTRDLQAAFEAYAQRAIAANNGVASDALRIEAAMTGVKLKTEKVAKATEKAAGGYREMAAGAAEATRAVEDLADAQAAARGEARASGTVGFDARIAAQQQGLPSDVIDSVIERYNALIENAFAGKTFSNRLPGEKEYRALYDQAVRDLSPAIAKAARGDYQTRATSQRQTVNIASFRVNLTAPGGQTTSVNVASQADQAALGEFFKRLEADMARAS